MGLKAIQGESKVISGSLWEHEKLWSSTEMLRWTEMLKLYFAPVLSRSGDSFTVTLKRAHPPGLPRADCTIRGSVLGAGQKHTVPNII